MAIFTYIYESKLRCKENLLSGCCHGNIVLARTGRFSELINTTFTYAQTHACVCFWPWKDSKQLMHADVVNIVNKL